MTVDVTAQRLFDGTFSLDAVASAAHAVVEQLHQEAMATIAALADNWDSPVEDPPAVEGEPVTYQDPATWSVADDDEYDYDDYAEDDDREVRLLHPADLPALLPLRPRPAAARMEPRPAAARMAQRPAADVTRAVAGAATDEILVPAEGDRQMVAS